MEQRVQFCAINKWECRWLYRLRMRGENAEEAAAMPAARMGVLEMEVEV